MGFTLKSQLYILTEWCERKPSHLEMLFTPRNADDGAQFKQKQRKVKMREMNCKWLRMSNIS